MNKDEIIKKTKRKKTRSSYKHEGIGYCQNIDCSSRGKQWADKDLIKITQKTITAYCHKERIILRVCPKCKEVNNKKGKEL